MEMGSISPMGFLVWSLNFDIIAPENVSKLKHPFLGFFSNLVPESPFSWGYSPHVKQECLMSSLEFQILPENMAQNLIFPSISHGIQSGIFAYFYDGKNQPFM